MEYQKIVVVSDLHINHQPGSDWQLNSHSLAAAIEQINTFHGDAKYCVLLGDLTHRGELESYRLLKKLLSKLQVSTVMTIGNHDQRDNFYQVFDETPIAAQAVTQGFVQSVVDIGEKDRLILLDTASGIGEGCVGRDIGMLCANRLQWLKEVLIDSSQKRVSIFMHHPPHDVGFPGMDAIKLHQSAAFYQLIKAFSCVAQIFTGHIHRAIAGNCLGIPFATFKSTGLQMPLNFTSLDTSLGVVEPAAFGVVLFSSTSIVVHEDQYDLDSAGTLRNGSDNQEAIEYWQQAKSFTFE